MGFRTVSAGMQECRGPENDFTGPRAIWQPAAKLVMGKGRKVMRRRLPCK